ncbi:hypothetical protein M569_13686 [Genlisea aurea]|uniref:RRM domain-containing protein n=1 Tax=Genlisea aurea TaxID=192259 RepID=S8C383_9LAMI|nr:hypothetical protein M569_13686 [Genlisea aurea]
MAFLNRARSLLFKATVAKNVMPGLSSATSSLFQSIRSMSSAKVFIGGLSFNTDEMSLKEAFSQYGEVIEARVILDRDTGRSRGFGFVTYTSSEAASSAIQALDGQDLHGRRVRVNYATDRPQRSFGGGYGSGGGGYGGGDYSGGGGYGSGGGFGYGSQSPSYGQGGGGGGGYDGNQYPRSGFGGGGDTVQGSESGGNFNNNYYDGNRGGSELGNEKDGFGDDDEDDEKNGDDDDGYANNTRS